MCWKTYENTGSEQKHKVSGPRASHVLIKCLWIEVRITQSSERLGKLLKVIQLLSIES